MANLKTRHLLAVVIFFSANAAFVRADVPPLPEGKPYNATEKEWLVERGKLREQMIQTATEDINEAVTTAEKIVTFERQLFGNVHKEVASSLDFLGNLYYRQGNYFSSAKVREEIMDITAKLLGEKHWRVRQVKYHRDKLAKLSTLSDEGKKHYFAEVKLMAEMPGLHSPGKYAQALEVARQATQLLEHSIGINNPDHAVVLLYQGAGCIQLGRYAEAEPFLTLASEISIAFYGADSLDYANAQFYLGELYLYTGALLKQEKALRAALTVYEKENDLSEIPRVLMMLGDAYSGKGEYGRAVEQFRKAADIRAKLHGKSSYQYHFCLTYLAGALHSSGKVDESEKICREALDWFQHQKEQDSLRLVDTTSVLCQILLNRGGKATEVISLVRKVQDFPLADRLGKQRRASLFWSEARAHSELKDYAAADAAAQKQLVIRQELDGAKSAGTFSAVRQLKDIRLKWANASLLAGQKSYGEQILNSVEVTYNTYFGRDHWETVSIRDAVAGLKVYANLSDEQRRRSDEIDVKTKDLKKVNIELKHAEICAIYEQAVRVREELYGLDDLQLAQLNYDLAYAYRCAGRPDSAEKSLERARSICLRVVGTKNIIPLVASILSMRAAIREERGEYQEAARHLTEARRVLNATEGNQSRNTLEVVLRLARNHIELGEMDRAESLLLELQSQWDRISGPESEPAATILHGVIVLHVRRGDYAQANALIPRAHSLFKPFGNTVTYIRFILDVGQAHADSGAYDHALAQLEWTRDVLKTLNYPEQPAWNAACLGRLAKVYAGKGKLDQAEQAAIEAVTLQRKRYPIIKAAWVREISALVAVFRECECALIDTDRLIECDKLLGREMAFWQTTFGENHWRTRNAKNRLETIRKVAALEGPKRERFVKAHSAIKQMAAELVAKSDWSSTLKLAKEISAQFEELIGREYVEFLTLQTLIVNGNMITGDVKAAHVTSEGLLAVAVRLQGPESELAGDIHFILASLCNSQGNSIDAQKHTLAAAEAYLRADCQESLTFLSPIIDQGKSFVESGDYSRAESVLRPVFGLIGRSHPQQVLHKIDYFAWYGTTLSRLGDHDRAEDMLKQAHDLAVQYYGATSIFRGSTSRLLGEHYLWIKDYQKAEAPFREAVDQWQRLGHTNAYLFSLMKLAEVLQHRGDPLVPGVLYQQAFDGYTKLHGADGLSVAIVREARGRMFLRRGDLDQAEQDFNAALLIRSKNLTGSLDGYSDSADLAFQMQQRERATVYYEKSLQNFSQQIAQWSTAQSETQQLLTAQQQHEMLGRLLSVDLAKSQFEKVEFETLYKHILGWKGAIFSRQQRLRALRDKAELASLFQDWEHASGQLATLALHAPYAEDFDVWVVKVRNATQERDRIEAQLAQAGSTVPFVPATLDALKATLPEKTALVDFVEYHRRRPKPGVKGAWDEERHMVAFVIQKDQPGRRIELGPTAAWTKDIDTWLQTVTVGGVNREASMAELAKLGRQIRQRIWDPLKPSLTDIESVLVSPDGALVRFPIAALPGDKDNSFLIEDIGIVMVPVPSLLPQLLNAPKSRADGSLVAFGDVNYGGSAGSADVRRKLQRNADGTRSWLPLGFGPLENTGHEVDEIRARFLTSFPNAADLVYKQSDSNEGQFRQQAQKARWLHLATHGFYAPDLLQTIVEGNTKSSAVAGQARVQPKIRFHPGLMSGLALAGANDLGKPDEDDGILSALEVASLDLTQVELAVLSACETAKGQETGGEGLLGLQRAFQVAGARSVVATLWPIHDAATRLLMMRFYRNLWEKKMSKLEALREAQLWIIKSARASRDAKQSPTTATLDSEKLPPMLLTPAIWAPFVLSGDWR